MKWIKPGYEFDELSDVILAASSKEVFIWGAGYFGEVVYDVLIKEIQLVGYIDSNPNKQHSMLNGLTIYSPDILKTRDVNKTIVLVAAGWTKDIFDELEQFGFAQNIFSFSIDDFVAIYMMYKYKKLYLVNVNISIGERCSLKCEKCSSLVPYYTLPKEYSLEEIKDTLLAFFKVTDYVCSLGLTGADAMLSPHLMKIIDFVGEIYGGTIGNIQLYTSGVLIPKPRLIDLMKKHNVYYRFTDYDLPKIQKIPEII
ncbi:MAG: hypothetical protein LBE13_13505, partial [Bacteroidales bacterium]|nr:hypothetical protein [Bacteroidales bacterium]